MFNTSEIKKKSQNENSHSENYWIKKSTNC
jgi:hypothetical protein